MRKYDWNIVGEVYKYFEFENQKWMYLKINISYSLFNGGAEKYT